MYNKKHAAAAEHDFAHAAVAGAGLILLVIALVFFGAYAHAATLGKLTVASALGQPLDAMIEVDATRHEIDTLGARLASPAAYRDAGMRRVPALEALSFSVVPQRNGRYVIRLASSRPLNEPVVDLLVEVAWRGGARSYAYTALLDPGVTSARTVVAPVALGAPSAEPASRVAAKRTPKVEEAAKRIAEQLRQKEERATVAKQQLIDARERIAELEITVRQQQQLLDMRAAAEVSRDADARPAAAAPQRTARVAAPASPSAVRWTDAIAGQPAYLGGAAALLLGALVIVKRRRQSDHELDHPAAMPQPA